MKKYQHESPSILPNTAEKIKPMAIVRRQALSLLIMGIVSTTTPATVSAGDYSESYNTNGNTRTIEVQGLDLESVHRMASNNFSKHLEKDLKSSNIYYAIKKDSFKTFVEKKNNIYTIKYTIELNPVYAQSKHFQIVDMRGSIIEGANSEQTAKSSNQISIPKWKKAMGETYIGMQYLGASSLHKTGKSSLYHEVFIGLGERKK